MGSESEGINEEEGRYLSNGDNLPLYMIPGKGPNGKKMGGEVELHYTGVGGKSDLL